VSAREVVSAETARRLLLGAQGLLADPARPATAAQVYRQIERMGFVQVDTINVVERAHHHILFSRFDDYEPATLARLLERDRRLFEHWTHDASIIPTLWFTHWKHRFERLRTKNERWVRRIGPGAEKVLDHVKTRIREEGPLRSADFEDERPPGAKGWWEWKPQKRALEYLWRTGELAIARRENFHKLYDLVERVLPDHAEAPATDPGEHLDFACRMTLERLGPANPRELRDFLYAAELEAVRGWCQRAAQSGEIVEVMVEGGDGSPPRPAYALPDWRRRARKLSPAPERMRLLSPFDPVLHDRARTQRLFDFEYTIECFVPAPKRRYGYYVMPLLEGERLVGRLDSKLHRDRGELEIKGLWWEPGVRPTRARLRALDDAVGQFATQLGAETYSLPGDA